MPFEFKKTEIEGVIIIVPKVFGDERGEFFESYKMSEFQKAGIKTTFVQDNFSKSRNGVLRGLHYQKYPFEQAKLVNCIKGEIFDVVVDIRKDSKTFGKHVSAILSEKNKNSLFVPRGFAHGFLVLSEKAEVVYKVDNEYSPKYESGLVWNDPIVSIDWPNKDPIVNERDKNWPTLKSYD